VLYGQEVFGSAATISRSGLACTTGSERVKCCSLTACSLSAKSPTRSSGLGMVPRLYGPSRDCKGEVWARGQVCANVLGLWWRSALLAKIRCARVCPYKSVGRSFETNLGIRLQTRRCDYSFVLGAAVRTSVGTLNPSSCGKAGARERFQAFSELLLTSSAQQRLKGADHRISRFLGSDSDDFRIKGKGN